jgi:hypothetical protein
MAGMSYWVADTALDGTFHEVTVLEGVPHGREGKDWWPIRSPGGMFAVRCSCLVLEFTGRMFCRHIDAPLAHGERSMVPEQDHEVLDRLQALHVEHIEQPGNWKFSWKRDMRWRGFPSRTRTSTKPRGPKVGTSGKPVVCFTGKMERPRKDMIAEAVTAGWEAADNVTLAIDIVVTGDPDSSSSKMRFAQMEGIPIISCWDWSFLMPKGEEGLRELAVA